MLQVNFLIKTRCNSVVSIDHDAIIGLPRPQHVDTNMGHTVSVNIICIAHQGRCKTLQIKQACERSAPAKDS